MNSVILKRVPGRGIEEIKEGNERKGSLETYGLVGHRAKQSVLSVSSFYFPSSIHPSQQPPQLCDKSTRHQEFSPSSIALSHYFKHLISPLSSSTHNLVMSNHREVEVKWTRKLGTYSINPFYELCVHACVCLCLSSV